MPEQKTRKKSTKTGRVIGRPSVFTEEVVRKLGEAFMIDATVREACAFAGIGHTAYYSEVKRNEEFADKMDRAQQFPFMLAKKTIVEAFKEKDGKLALKWLQNRQRDVYHEKHEQSVKVVKDGAAELAEMMMGAEQQDTAVQTGRINPGQ